MHELDFIFSVSAAEFQHNFNYTYTTTCVVYNLVIMEVQRDNSAIILQLQDYRLQPYVGQSKERLYRPRPKGSDME